MAPAFHFILDTTTEATAIAAGEGPTATGKEATAIAAGEEPNATVTGKEPIAIAEGPNAASPSSGRGSAGAEPSPSSTTMGTSAESDVVTDGLRALGSLGGGFVRKLPPRHSPTDAGYYPWLVGFGASNPPYVA
jgi:hypothetical protein